MKSIFSSKITLFFISLSLSLAILLGFSLQANLSIERPIKIIDLSTMTQEQVLSWATENELLIETIEAYDEVALVGSIMSQDINVGERLFAGSTLTITVSKGPDPDVLVSLVDFSGKDIGDVQTFIDSNKLMNAKIEFQKNTKIASAFFISQTIKEGQIKRSDAISFYISTGDKDTLTTVIVPDFSTYTKQQISSWGSSSNIKINFIEEFNSSVEAGKVYEQSLAANQEIYDGSSITIKLSKGTGVVLENLVGKSKSEIDAFIKNNGLSVTYTSVYSSTQSKDFATSMSPSAATRVANNSSVAVTLSLGKISVSDFTGKSLKELEAWIAEVNKQGANLKVSSSSIYSDSVTAGNLIKQTPATGEINPGSTITASVSKGLGVTVKDFNSRTDTQDGLSISIQERYSTSASGTVISQSISAGTLVDRGTGITLTVSIGSIGVSSYIGNSLSALQGWINDVNGKGANLSLSTSESYNSATKGSVVSQSPASGTVSPGSTISATISKGAGVTVNNFVGGTSTSQSGLNVSTSSAYSSSVASGVVMSQSISSGSVVDSGSTISLVVSAGVDPATVPIYLPPLAPMVSTSTTGYSNTVSYLSSYLSGLGFTNFGFTSGNYSISTGQVNSQSPGPGSYSRDTRIEIQVQQ